MSGQWRTGSTVHSKVLTKDLLPSSCSCQLTSSQRHLVPAGAWITPQPGDPSAFHPLPPASWSEANIPITLPAPFPPAPAVMKFRRENVGNCGAGALNNLRYEQTRDVATGQVLSLCPVVVTKQGSGRENTSLQWIGGLGCFLCGVCVGFLGGAQAPRASWFDGIPSDVQTCISSIF